MKHARFIAATVLAALLLAGCTGRRTAGDAADKASAGDGTSETAVSTPDPTGEETPAGERSPLAASRTWTGRDGSTGVSNIIFRRRDSALSFSLGFIL